MGICWSAPPAVPVATVLPPAKTVTYDMKDPEKPVYYQYPQQQYAQQTIAYPYQQQQQYYVQNPYPPQHPYPIQQYPQQQQQISPVTAFVGGMLLGSIVDDIVDPFD